MQQFLLENHTRNRPPCNVEGEREKKEAWLQALEAEFTAAAVLDNDKKDKEESRKIQTTIPFLGREKPLFA